tara:strand:+ start:1965 stop:2819 length:855 start_codon:yes stop_codon:yes gene_type:complete
MDSLINILLEPFVYTYMQQAFAIVLIISIPTSLLSCFLVLKGWSLMGDAIAHSVLPGVVIAYIVGIPIAIGAFIAAMISAVATGFFNDNTRLREDTIMGIVFSSMFALGIVMMTKIESGVHLDHILFGDVLGVSWQDILESAIITILVSLFIFYKGKDLMLYVFDSQHAKAIGLNINFYQYSILILLSLTIVGALKAVGMILVIALLITPGAIANLLTDSFKRMLLVSLFVSSTTSILGVYISFYINSAPAPTIIVLLSLIFIMVFFYQNRQIKFNESSLKKPT